MHDTTPQFQALYESMLTFVNTCMSGHDPSHNPAHVHRVVALANIILDAERALHPNTDYDGAVVKLAALLHDIGDRKYLHTLTAEGENETLEPTTMVRHALVKHGAPVNLASKVQTVVSHVSYSTETKNPSAIRQLIDNERLIELAIVQDADRLDAIGAIGIGRTFTFLGAQGTKFLVDGKWEMNNSIEHFGEKLELLEGMMKTETGRKMAQERTERLRIFRGWWEEEMELISASRV
ncbi:hypothetical protein N7532_010892 [Penicillium argentinense]|uniref:HD/PDEase domain-containing protein n=1 Tax=Penicillium argentinense TaxID=1131581 RepID=A0A9W9EQK1_9EURO|nr:uncharacterized protein N7532_010892 [Penicillium argentinense]KAJ5086121.1 hypothetical protein N7532_010892 [Penicillium argentinense]